MPVAGGRRQNHNTAKRGLREDRDGQPSVSQRREHPHRPRFAGGRRWHDDCDQRREAPTRGGACEGESRMKYLDFSSLLEADPAHIAFLSTFQFDPDFFERRLLCCPTLTKARRIVIFMDARQWFDLLRRDVPARWLNRRYLVVPVQ